VPVVFMFFHTLSSFFESGTSRIPIDHSKRRTRRTRPSRLNLDLRETTKTLSPPENKSTVNGVFKRSTWVELEVVWVWGMTSRLSREVCRSGRGREEKRMLNLWWKGAEDCLEKLKLSLPIFFIHHRLNLQILNACSMKLPRRNPVARSGRFRR
jgi:hypothetical protein